jgi:mRNA-degrading endonuclease toxin of MazEF toxin-antitoxin module
MPNPRPRFQVGEILWAELPYRVPPGHEQIGHRPVVVVPKAFGKLFSLSLTVS